MTRATTLSNPGFAGFALGPPGSGVCASVPTVLRLHVAKEVLRMTQAVPA